MKNVHLIPTDKPTRLFKVSGELKLTRNFDFYNGSEYQNIYITSDEEIKEGDWFYWTVANSVQKAKKDNLERLPKISDGSHKIILTDNKDLIKDGIQAIDDTFLEWFVKNPNCEEVEVEPDYDEIRGDYYRIVILQEETLEEYLQICKDCGSKEVARCKWVNVNTEEIYSADSGTNLEWCFNCKSETKIINKEDYETKIQ
jgi:hypothetical protein